MVKTVRVVVCVVFVLLLLPQIVCIFDHMLPANSANASTNSLTMMATIQPSMTLTVSDSKKTITLAPSNTGTFGSTDVTVKAYSNGSIGYTLTMTPSSTTLVGSGVNAIPTLAADSTCTGGSVCNSNNFAPGYWGIAIGDEVYKAASTRNITTVSDTSADAVNNTYTVNLGANVDFTVPIDNYTTTIDFALTSSQIATYDITFNYDSNFTSFALEELSGAEVSPISTSTNSKTYSLEYASSYILTASFTGPYWFGTADMSSNSNLINLETQTITVGGTDTITLTSHHKCNPAGTTIGTIVCMQDINDSNRGSVISSMTQNTNYVLYDSRDDQAYTVALLLDGKVWMTNNLNLAGETKLYSDTSDVPSGYPESGNVAYYQLPTSATKNNDNNNLTSTAQFSSNSTAYVFNSGNSVCSSTAAPCYSYYSWTAAIAGSPAGTTTYHNAPYSICPKGWRLPASATNNQNPQSNNNWETGDWYALGIAYGVNSESHAASSSEFYDNAGPSTVVPGLKITGYYNKGSFETGSSTPNGGFYWSSTISSSTSASSMSFNSSRYASAPSNSRYLGFSVRCILRNN